MDRWREPEYAGEFPSLGWLALDWIEEFLVIPDGPHRGEPLVLTDEQARFFVRLYRLHPVTGRPVVRRATIVRPKGWGKGPLLATASAFEGCGPCCFDGWDADGNPVGAPWPTPWVQLAAGSESQTTNNWSLLVEMLREGTAGDEFHLDVGQTRVFTPGGGRIEPVTSAAGSREGQRVTFGALDETQLWLPNTGGVRLAATIRRNTGKTGGRTVEASNCYVPGQRSVAEESAKSAQAGQEGLLYDHRQFPGVVSLKNKQELRKALRHVYGDARWIDVDRIMAEIADSATDENDARRFYLNEVVQSASHAFDGARWAELARPDIVVPPGSWVTLGFDGARFHDTTALIGTVIGSGHQFVLGRWARPEDAPDGWEVDEASVDAAVIEAFDTFDVWRMYGDPPWWEAAMDRWSGRWGERVVSWWTNRDKQMGYAVRAYVTAQRSGELSHDGDPAFAAHVANARKRDIRALDEEGLPLYVITKEHRNSRLKIDMAVAGCLSWEARGDAIASGDTSYEPATARSEPPGTDNVYRPKARLTI